MCLKGVRLKWQNAISYFYLEAVWNLLPLVSIELRLSCFEISCTYAHVKSLSVILLRVIPIYSMKAVLSLKEFSKSSFQEQMSFALSEHLVLHGNSLITYGCDQKFSSIKSVNLKSCVSWN